MRELDGFVALADELLRPDGRDVALRHGRRWLRTFENVRGVTASSGTARLRDGGVYLITGGLGGIGLNPEEDRPGCGNSHGSEWRCKGRL